MKFYASIAAGVQRRKYMFFHVFFLPPTKDIHVLPVFVCLSVSKITQKRVHHGA